MLCIRMLTIASLFLMALGGGVGDTLSAFSSTTANVANTATAGTVVLSDNDANNTLNLFNISGMVPSQSEAQCITVTYGGTLPAQVRLYGTTTGTGLDPYVNLTVTRGSIASGSFGSCSGFIPDTADPLGQGRGVIYSGTLQGYADNWAGGIADLTRPGVQKAWTPNEAHAYKVQVTLQDDNNARGLGANQTFTWEARNTTLYSQVVLSDGPSSYWKLDEAAGTSAADAAGSVTATYTNGAVVNQPSGVKDASTAATFDGTDDWVSAGGVYPFNGTASFSVECWLNRTAGVNEGAWRKLVSKEGGNTGWYVGIPPSSDAGANKVRFTRLDQSASGAADSVDSATVTQGGTWYHVVATYDGATMRLYLNGNLESSVASTRSAGAGTSPLSLASFAGTSHHFAGTLDEVAVYSSVLSATKVAEHYNAGH